MIHAYVTLLRRDPDCGWRAEFFDLPGCTAAGGSADAAIAAAAEALAGELALLRADKRPLPMPTPLDAVIAGLEAKGDAALPVPIPLPASGGAPPAPPAADRLWDPDRGAMPAKGRQQRGAETTVLARWNYRIVRHRDGGGWLGLHEVYYGADGRPEAMTAEPASFVADLEEGPEGIVAGLAAALDDARSRGLLDEEALHRPTGSGWERGGDDSR